jgi:hypothetical protein
MTEISEIAKLMADLDADQQAEVLRHLDSVATPEFLAQRARTKIQEVKQTKIARQLESISRRLEELQKHPSANRDEIRKVTAEWDRVHRELEASK